MVSAADHVVVAFAGDGCGVGEMSWGQREIWASMVRCESSKPVGGVTALAAGTTVEDVANELRYLMSRYQVMRTRLLFDRVGWPQQVVSTSGEATLEIFDAGDADPAEVAEAVCDQYRRTPFDYALDWPVRMAVIRRRSTVTHLAAIMCHIAIDGSGAAVMMREVAGATTDPVVGMQPLEQASWQRSAAGRRQNQAALRYWGKLLRSMPPPWFGTSSDRRQPRQWEGLFDSPAMLLAVRAIIDRTQADDSTIILAAFAMAMARITGVNPVAIRPMASNRFRPGLAEVVGPVCQAGLCVLDVAAGSFDETLRRVQLAITATYKYAYFDPAQMRELVAEVVAERGPEFDVDCFFNDRRIVNRRAVLGTAPTRRSIRNAARQSVFRWIDGLDSPSPRLYVQVEDVPDKIQLNIFADTCHLSPADAEALMRETETVVIDASLDLVRH